MNDMADWAQEAASELLHEFSDSMAIDTGDYQLCEFILAAAKIVMSNRVLAAEVGALMESRRSDPCASDISRSAAPSV